MPRSWILQWEMLTQFNNNIFNQCLLMTVLGLNKCRFGILHFYTVHFLTYCQSLKWTNHIFISKAYERHLWVDQSTQECTYSLLCLFVYFVPYSTDVLNIHRIKICKKTHLYTFIWHDDGVPPWSSWLPVGPQITTTWVRISASAYLKGVSSLTSLHYPWGSIGPFSLPCAQKWP